MSMRSLEGRRTQRFPNAERALVVEHDQIGKHGWLHADPVAQRLCGSHEHRGPLRIALCSSGPRQPLQASGSVARIIDPP
jgi:hypothetical protein